MAIQLGGGLGTGLLGSRREDSDENPMSSLANLADVMLVFACGLMMAVVLAWDVETQISTTELTEENKLSEVEDVEQMEEELSEVTGNSYVDMGRVYMDPSTGKYYIAVEESAGDADAAGAEGETSAEGDAGESSGADTSSSEGQ